MRSVAVGLVLAAQPAVGGRAVGRRGVAVMADRQLGIALPAEGAETLDFEKVRPPPLLAVTVDADAAGMPTEVGASGSANLVLSVDLETGQSRLSKEASNKSGQVGAAWARYNNTVQQNGWAYLSVAATEDERISSELKMYAAGYLEGFVSAKSIRDFQHNAGELLKKDETKHQALGNVRDMFGRSVLKIVNRSDMVPGTGLTDGTAPQDDWWRQARYALLQVWGILDGYNTQVDKVNGTAMSMVDLLVLNSDGETPELEMAYDLEEQLLRESEAEDAANSNSSNSTAQAFLQRGAHRTVVSSKRAQRQLALRRLNEKAWRHIKETTGRCSALVRLTEGNKDLMVGHATFSDYSEMTRIFKFYDFPLGGNAVRRMGFSSYPGVAGSTDDYYVLDSGLVVTETTISMLTDEPYDKLDNTDKQVPDFMRIMLANRLAKNGTNWAELMRKSATGTYSSQWMVVDYNLFQPGRAEIQNGTLVVLEQVPGLSHSEDMSHRLQTHGYWASENRAWYKDVRDSIGASEAEDIHGALFSADRNPRATIFTKTAPQVQSLADMRSEMRRNRWPHEVFVEVGNTPDHAIAARGDLDKSNPSANGGVDAKVTNFCLAKRLQADAISGPSAETQTPFRWRDPKTGKELFPGAPHDGLPDLWNFDWVRMSLEGEVAVGDCQ